MKAAFHLFTILWRTPRALPLNARIVNLLKQNEGFTSNYNSTFTEKKRQGTDLLICLDYADFWQGTENYVPE